MAINANVVKEPTGISISENIFKKNFDGKFPRKPNMLAFKKLIET